MSRRREAGCACERAVLDQLSEMQRHAAEQLHREGLLAEDEAFYAEQNARLVKNAEQYYRTMLYSNVKSWNLRGQHMSDTLSALEQHLSPRRGPAKIVVWEHNSHLGDARATEMGERGETNVGHIARERYGDAVVLVGLTTQRGTVAAASDWGEPAERKPVRPALPNSYEALFHKLDMPRFMVDLGEADAQLILGKHRLERPIGVIYHPETERLSHYFDAHLPAQFNLIVHFDQTRAVEPLERSPRWVTGEPEPTFPVGV
jgi:erythromycin esterase-like protein